MVTDFSEAFDDVMVELDRIQKAFVNVQGDPAERVANWALKSFNVANNKPKVS